MKEPPERLVHIIADPNCYYCKGEGMEADYEGYPTPMPVYWWPCRCVEKRWCNTVEYFERYPPLTNGQTLQLPDIEILF